ncbi:MAG: TonB-dependent receptor [Prevotellaceae bacterium]|nr:TonB-dependent receptor [Prevotellaceae bacterium]
MAFGQSSQITGTVSDASTGEALIGVAVSEKGVANATITDIDGRYAITARPGATLVFSYVGYETQEIAATGGTLDVTLQPGVTALDEVVVVGYGVQKKSVVTAAISSVKASELEKVAPSSIGNVLKGQVSGVIIVTGSGQPNDDATVRIRGIGTTGTSSPLWIVDGMAVDGGVRNVNPADIASVEVLKDAASAAVYGARAANGVILVTTKTGTLGAKPRISYDMSIGFQNPWRKKAVLNAEEYMVIHNELRLNNGEPLPFSAKDIADARAGLTPNTDWQDEVFYRNALMHNHQLSIAGGTEKLSYYVSLGYFDQDGIIGGNYDVSNYSRWNIRSNATYEVFNTEKQRSFLNKIKIGINTTYGRANSIGVGNNEQVYSSPLGEALVLPPTMSVYLPEEEGKALLEKHPYAITSEDGRVYTPSPSGFNEPRNPLAHMQAPDRIYSNEDKFIGSFFGELNILKGLVFKSNYGFDLAFWGSDGYRFPYYLADVSAPQNEDPLRSEAWSSMNRGYTWQIENTLTYTTQIADVHNINVLLGQSARHYGGRSLSGNGYELIAYDPDMAVINSSRADQEKGGRRSSGGTSASSLASYFARVDYNYDERYMIQGTVRRDGSDKFGPGNKWGVFPSVSVGWNLTNEPYLKGFLPELFNTIKLRASWGVNGNEAIGQFKYMSLMDGGQNYYFGAGSAETMYYGISSAGASNAELRWEESKQTDLGIDLALFNNAITFTFDWFSKRTEGMLANMPIPRYVGLNSPVYNIGVMENRGLEFDMGYKTNIHGLNFAVKANFSYVKNTLVEMGNASGENSWGGHNLLGLDNFIFQKNGMVNPFFYGYRADGIIQTQDEADAYNLAYNQTAVPGDVRFKNLNGDEVIDANDREMIGKPDPDWVFGFTLNADYKGFDFYAFFQGVWGNDIFIGPFRTDISMQNFPAWIMDRWTGDGSSNTIPRLTTNDPNRNYRASDLLLRDGAYCRLKNIQVGYTLPKHITQKVSVERLRFYVGADNLLTLTGYKDGFDPEVGGGVDYGNYPHARVITFGANITF